MRTTRFSSGSVFSGLVIVLAALALGVPAANAQGTITTLAGSGVLGFSGDGGSAINASFNLVYGSGIDGSGNFYIVDRGNQRIRRVTSNGVVSTVVGNGVAGFSGDGGPAILASLNDPTGIAVDSAGTIYIADASNRRVRRVAPNGTITTFAGTGVQGFSGDGGQAIAAQLNRPVGVFLDAFGNLLIADSPNHRVRRVGADGIITTVAGNGVAGFSGDGGLAISAQLSTPLGMSVDAAGVLYIADADNHRIRRVGADGINSTVAGNGTGGFSGDGGAALTARLNFPSDVAVDGAGNLFIADASNNRVRQVANLSITTIAGTGSDSFSGDGGPGTSAAVNFPYRVALGSPGSLLISDARNHRLRRLTGTTTPLPTPSPILPANSSVNGASFQSGLAVAPGAIIAIFGTNLAGATTGASSVPLPTTLGDTSVLINGVAAPLFFVSAGQINAQAPFTLLPGSATVQVRRGGNLSATQTVNVAAGSPGIFTINQQGSGQGAILTADGRLADGSAAVAAGEVVQVFMTGLGATQPAVGSGLRAPAAEPLARVPGGEIAVTVGGVDATVEFAGLAPNFVGLYQVNVRIPAGVAAGGAVSLVLTQRGIPSNTATLAIR